MSHEPNHISGGAQFSPMLPTPATSQIVISPWAPPQGTATTEIAATDSAGTMPGIYERSRTEKSIGSRSDQHTWDQISDVKLTLYMREKSVKFTASGLSPETLHFVFFDRDNVTDMCRSSGKAAPSVDGLISDASGVINGVFAIPPNRFFTGAKVLKLTTVKDADQWGSDADYSTASATYFAGGLDLTKQEINMTVITPTWSEQTFTESMTIPNPPAPPVPPGQATEFAAPAPANQWAITFGGGRDPVAQSFRFDGDRFITGVDLFLATIDKENPSIWVSVRKMENGYPVSTDLGKVDVNLVETSAMADPYGQTLTRVTFPHPIRTEGGKEHCIVVGGWSPGTRVWVSRVGDPLIDNQDQIVETQPLTGSFFKSQNGTTWNAEQFEDLKFNLRIAKFKSKSMVVGFTPVNEPESLPEDPFECEAGIDLIRVYCPAHGLNAGDKFYCTMFSDEKFAIVTDNGQTPLPGQTMYSSTGHAKIKSTDVNQTDGFVWVTVESVVGYFLSDQVFTTDSFSVTNTQNEVTSTLSVIRGTIKNAPLAVIAGIPVGDLTGEQTVESVDSINTFKFKLKGDSMPTSSGRFGGRGGKMDINVKYDVFNISGSHMLYGSQENWFLKGIGHNPPQGAFPGIEYSVMDDKPFIVAADTFLDRPMKMANDLNQNSKISDKKSVKIIGAFTSQDNYTSAVINSNSFSMIAISNNVGWFDETSVGAPNASSFYEPETSTIGSEPYKYVTKGVTLSKPASDIRIIFDALVDENSTFSVYYKLVYAHEVVRIDDVDWTEIPDITIVPSANANDFVEYEFTLSESMGSLWSVNPFSQFKIKIVGKSKNSAHPPTFKNFKAIALT